MDSWTWLRQDGDGPDWEEASKRIHVFDPKRKPRVVEKEIFVDGQEDGVITGCTWWGFDKVM